MNTREKTGIFTGTFDPFTIGHANIVKRGLPLFDHLVIGVAESWLKNAHQSVADRVATIRSLYANEPRISVVSYNDLTADLVQREHASFLLRGVRSVADYEYERNQAEVNLQLCGVETILLFSEPSLASVSSTLVRELEYFGKDVQEFLPTNKAEQ